MLHAVVLVLLVLPPRHGEVAAARAHVMNMHEGSTLRLYRLTRTFIVRGGVVVRMIHMMTLATRLELCMYYHLLRVHLRPLLIQCSLPI